MTKELRYSKRKFVWLEEYKRCGCSNVTEFRKDALGYCPKHATDKRRLTKIEHRDMELGFAGVG